MQYSACSMGRRALRASGPILLLIACTMAGLALSGCRARQSSTASGEGGLSGNIQTYQLKGIVVSSQPAAGEVTIDSEAIPGFMEAMVMPYKLAQPNIAGELHPGDHITGRLRVSDSASELDQIVVTAQAKPDYKPSVFYNIPKPGQTVPDFKFLNQNGKTIDISRFRGKVLLLTFIYTRCPLPDFCIRMSRNFAKIDQALAATPQLYDRTHLLSISFDPANDTPKVLRAYGSEYTRSKEAFSHWDFAAPPQAELPAVSQFFDLGITPGANQTLNHSLSTVVVGPDGKVLNWYPTNEWKPEDILKDVKQALAPANA